MTMAAESIVSQIAALKPMTVSQLREVYAEKFGESSNSRNKVWLFKRIAFTSEKSEVAAPIPSANERTVTAVKTGLPRNIRHP